MTTISRRPSRIITVLAAMLIASVPASAQQEFEGGSRGATALQDRRLDAMHVGLSSVIRLNRAGGDLRLIGSLSNVIRFTFFSAPGVKAAADLKGGVVGVSTFGSESDSTVTLAMQRLGMNRSDITVKEQGGGPAR